MSQPVRHSIDLEVRYAETDQMGVVHHANYLIWFEQARTGLCAGSGRHYADIERDGHLLMVTGAELSYRQGARYGDTVRVTAWVDKLESRGIRFAYEVHRGDRLLATGATRHIWIRRSDGRPCRMPAELKSAFERLARGPSPSS